MATPLAALPREIRNHMLFYLLSSEIHQDHAKQYLSLAFSGKHRYLMHNRELLEHPIRRVNHQLYEESTEVIRDLLTHARFQLGSSLADGYMVYLILRAMSPALCSLVRTVELGEDTFNNGGNGDINHAFWEGSSSLGHLGEMMVAKLVYLRSVSIRTPMRHCNCGNEPHGPDDECTAERYNTLDLCTSFFAAQLGSGRIDSVELLIERDIPDLTLGSEVKVDDPVHVYVAAVEKPWSSLDRSTHVENIGRVDQSPWMDPRDGNRYRWTKPKRKWTITFTRKATDRHTPGEVRG